MARLGAATLTVAFLAGACSSAEPVEADNNAASTIPATPFVIPTSPTPTPTGPSVQEQLQPFLAQELAWEGCGGDSQCADLLVPLDYEEPARADLTLALVRKRATNPDERIGSLVLNPGGPGGSGFDYVDRGRRVVSPGVAARFDLVGFDPRGVQRSEPVRCLTNAETDEFYAFDGSPDTDAEADAALALGREFAQKCSQKEADLLPFLGTRDAARDMDVLRAALGEERLHFIGKSYGTALGAEYARQFPERVGRFILDGALDPEVGTDAFARGQAQGFERALQAFLTDCVQRSSCPLGRQRGAAEDRLNEFLDGLDAEPLRVGGRELTQSLGTLAVIASLYSQSSWERLRTALRDGLAGEGAGLLSLSDFYSDRDSSGEYLSNGLDAIYAISCVDRADTKNRAQTQALADDLERNYSRTFGAYLAWGNTPCQNWPVPVTRQQGPIAARGAAPIIVVGTTRDSATPYEWSVALAEQLDSGVLVTRNGDGHTGYRAGSACTDAAVDQLLLTGRPPEADVVCSS